MVKIRLKRFGQQHQPSYRIVVMDSRANRDGKAIDEIGFYHPRAAAAADQIRLDGEKAAHWISKGAQPTDTVRRLINRKKLEAR